MSYSDNPYDRRPPPGGSLRLFQARGIDVYLHWSWLVVAVYELRYRDSAYRSQVWNVLEYLTLFGIVLIHEFGHALACRSVGGRADQIMLWPLGGVAFVRPPHRPGATLWSIAAGPLVNVVLLPLTIAAYWGIGRVYPDAPPDLHLYLQSVALINGLLLAFNLLPIYPLDGGQILMSILWYFMSFERALSVAATIGMLGAGAVMGLALAYRNIWLIVIALFAASQCYKGLQIARSIRDAKAETQYTRRGL